MVLLKTFYLFLLGLAEVHGNSLAGDRSIVKTYVPKMINDFLDMMSLDCSIFLLEMNPLDGHELGFHIHKRAVLWFTNRKDWESGVTRIQRNKCQYHIIMGKFDQDMEFVIKFIWDQKLTRDGFGYLFITNADALYQFEKIPEVLDIMNIFIIPIKDSESKSIYTIDAFNGKSDKTRLLQTWSKYHSESLSMADSSRKFRDLNGMDMKCAYLDVFPYFFNNNQNKFKGVDGDIIKTIGEKMNYGLKFHISIDGNFGVIKSGSNKSFNGMVGMAQRKEVDCAISSITKAYQRNKVIDYSIGTFTVHGAFITRKTGPVPKWRAMMDPFGIEVWIALIVTIIGFIWVYHFILKLSKQEETVSIQVSILNIWGSFFNQNMKHPKKLSSRILIAFWFLFSICIVTSYAGSLSSFLTLPRRKAPIDFLRDLINSPMRILTLKNSFLELVFKNSDDKTFTRAYESFVESEQNGLLCEDIPTCINLVHDNPDISFMYDSGILESHILTIPGSKNNIRIGKGYFLPSEYAIIFRKNVPYLDQFDINLLRLKESGLLKKWRNDPLAKRKFENEGKDLAKKKLNKSQESPTGNESITLYHLQGAFMLYALGITLSIIAFFRENHKLYK